MFGPESCNPEGNCWVGTGMNWTVIPGTRENRVPGTRYVVPGKDGYRIPLSGTHYKELPGIPPVPGMKGYQIPHGTQYEELPGTPCPVPGNPSYLVPDTPLWYKRSYQVSPQHPVWKVTRYSMVPGTRNYQVPPAQYLVTPLT